MLSMLNIPRARALGIPQPARGLPTGLAYRGRMDQLDGWATGRLLSAAARLVEHEWNAHLVRWDLNHAGLAVLHVLLAGPRTQRELATAVQVEDQTMSRTLERLERSRYVERRRDDADRRRVVVTLTDEGRATCLSAGDLAVAESMFEPAVEDLPAFRQALAGVIRHLSRQRWPTSGHPGQAEGDDSDRDDSDRDDAQAVDAEAVDAQRVDAEGDDGDGPGQAHSAAANVR